MTSKRIVEKLNTATHTRYAYQAVAQYDNRDAGHVCYGATKDEARAHARERTQMSIVVRRVRVTPDHYAAIAAGSPEADSLTYRIR
jgi:hypothetical protein